MFGGYFVKMSDSNVYLHWMFRISFVKYGFEGLMLSIFGYDRGKLPCGADYCHYVYPERFLEEVDMASASYSFTVLVLISLTICVRLLAFIALKIKLWITN